MGKRKEPYIIVSANSHSTLSVLVLAEISNGYSVLGGLVFGNGKFCQAMELKQK